MLDGSEIASWSPAERGREQQNPGKSTNAAKREHSSLLRKVSLIMLVCFERIWTIGGKVTRVWARLAFGDTRFPDAHLGEGVI